MASLLFTVGGTVVNALPFSGNLFFLVGSQIMAQNNAKDMI